MKTYDILVQAYDNPFGRGRSHSGYMLLSIYLLNVDDVQPRFTQKYYTMNLIESAPIGYSVLTISANDEDGPSDFIFSITAGNEESKFEINAGTGVIFVAGSFDYMVKTFYNMTVSAKQANTQYDAFANVIIQVVYPQPKSIQFLKSQYDITIVENSSPQTLLQLNTTFNTLNQTFDLLNRSDATEFELNRQTGILSSKHAFDYEKASQYHLVISVSYGNKKAQVLVVVTVLNVDDENPYFLSPLNQNITVSEGKQVGDILGIVVAEDADPESEITFSLSLSQSENILQTSESELIAISSRSLKPI